MKTVKELKAFLEQLPDDAYVAKSVFRNKPQVSIINRKTGDVIPLNIQELSTNTDRSYLEQLRDGGKH